MLRRLGLLTFALVIGAVSSLVTVPARVAADNITCTGEIFAVTLLPLDSTPYHVFGNLCWRDNLSHKTLQLLLPGYTYDHTYWDFPYQQPAYSYAAAAVQAGYATLAIDRIGVGLSNHPSPELLTVSSEAQTVHQIIQALRSGGVENTAFSRIVAVGHSLGTLVAWSEAATYHDVDGLIASGWLHAVNPTGAGAVAANSYPATLDPKFANTGLPLGYETTLPGSRGGIFYNAADADPNVIALDEILKQTGTDGEEATFGSSDDPLITSQIDVPVLAAVGQADTLFCTILLPCSNGAAVVHREQTFYGPGTCLQGFTLPNSGHDLNLHLNAGDWYAAANAWVAAYVGATPTTPPTQACL